VSFKIGQFSVNRQKIFSINQELKYSYVGKIHPRNIAFWLVDDCLTDS